MAATVAIDLNEIHSLTDFQRNAKDHIARIKKTKRPLVLTVNGKAEVVVQDATRYQEMLDALERAETIEAIRIGLEQVKQGKTKPAKQVFEEMRKKYNLPKKRP